MTVSATVALTNAGTGMPGWVAVITMGGSSDPLTNGRIEFQLSGDTGDSHAFYLPVLSASDVSDKYAFCVPYDRKTETCVAKVYNGSTLLATSSTGTSRSAEWTYYAYLAGRCPDGWTLDPIAKLVPIRGEHVRLRFPSRSNAFDILSSPYPLVVSDVRQGPALDLPVLSDMYSVQVLNNYLGRGGVYQLEMREQTWVPSGTVMVGDLDTDELTATSDSMRLILPLTYVQETRA